MVALAAALPAANAQQYPSKPIRLVVGFAAGGPSDVAARTIAQKLAEKWGQQVIVDIRPGASGNIATEIVAKAPPDGYTLLEPAFAHAVNPFLYSKLPFDASKDFAPVLLFASIANVLVVHPSIPARSVAELIAFAKAHPGQLTAGSSGNGTASHLAVELLNMMGGIKTTHVPYKGLAPAHTDLMGGQITMLFDGIVTGMPAVKAGRLRALAVTTAKRWQGTPDIPTMAEAGLAGFEVNSWYGLLAPANTPEPVVNRLYTVTQKILSTPAVRERLASLGMVVSPMPPAEFGAFIVTEITRWTADAKAAGIEAK